MSSTTIELSDIATPQAPQAVFAKSSRVASTRRPSTIVNEARNSGVSLRELERIETASKGTTAIVIASVTLVTGISSLLNGLTTVILPTMAVDLDIPDNLLLWYHEISKPLRLYEY